MNASKAAKKSSLLPEIGENAARDRAQHSGNQHHQPHPAGELLGLEVKATRQQGRCPDAGGGVGHHHPNLTDEQRRQPGATSPELHQRGAERRISARAHLAPLRLRKKQQR